LLTTHNVPYVQKCIRYIFKQQIRRLPGFSQPGKLKEESASRITKSFSGACNAESLARKSAAEQPEFWHCFWVCFSCIFYEPLSLRVKQGIVTAVGVFIDFAVSYARKAPGTGQPLAETTDAGEHIDEFNQAPGSLWTWVLFWAYLIGTPHQKQKQPVTGCTEQDFFTVHYVSTSFFLLLFYLSLKHWNHPLQ
jgi:hypothetical protein